MHPPSPWWRRTVAAPAVAALVVTALAACATSRPSGEVATSTTEELYRAIGASDGAAACTLLTPAVVEVLEEDSGGSCDTAVLDGDVGEDLRSRADGDAVSSRIAGRLAQVMTSTDVVFLTVSGDGWLITAAGCDPREDRPYHCVLEGG